MEGSVNWPQLSFISGVVVLVAGFMFIFAWRTQEIRAKDRSEQRALFQQEIAAVHELVAMVQKDLDSRLRAIEMANAGILVVLKHMEDFKREIMERLESMRDERSEDMELLYRRLDGIYTRERIINVVDPDQR